MFVKRPRDQAGAFFLVGALHPELLASVTAAAQTARAACLRHSPSFDLQQFTSIFPATAAGFFGGLTHSR